MVAYKGSANNDDVSWIGGWFVGMSVDKRGEFESKLGDGLLDNYHEEFAE
jgi:hypothetical protein